MGAMKHALFVALLIGVPLMSAFAVIANSVDLSRAVTIALYALALAVPIFAGLLADARRRGIPTRLDRRHRATRTGLG